MRKIAIALCAAAMLAGCTSVYQLQVMPRDSGKIYTGTWQGDMQGGGTITIALPDRTYAGPVVRTTSGHTYGFYQSFGWRRFGAGFGTVDFYNRNQRMKALLSSPDGHGLRCDFSGDGEHVGGICADDDKHVYDVIATAQ